MSEEKEVFLIKEKWWESIVSDIFSIGSLIGATAFNYFLLGNTWASNLAVLILFFSYLSYRSTKKQTFKSYGELVEYIDEIENKRT